MEDQPQGNTFIGGFYIEAMLLDEKKVIGESKEKK